MGLAENIKTKRRESGMTQLELAQKLGYKTTAVVSKAENGTRVLTDEELAAFATALGTTPEALCAEAEINGPATPAEEPTPAEEVPETEPEETKDNLYREDDASVNVKTVVRRRPSWMAIFAFVLSLLLLVGLCASVLQTLYLSKALCEVRKTHSTTVTVVTQDTPPHDYTTPDDGRLDAAALVKDVMPSVVYVETTYGSGSGFFLTEDGWIVTCAHVLSSCKDARQISITTNDEEVYVATEFHFDTMTDIGVVKIQGTFPAATLGDSDKVQPGESVVAIGSPGRDLFQTVTAGVVSGLRTHHEFADLDMILDVIQHDAAINSGNSGGPLFNAYGQVIGINSIKMSSSYENIAYAVTSKNILRVTADLIKYGVVDRPMVGISGSTNAGDLAGVLVAALTPGGSAAEAGVLPGDIITYADDTRIKTISQLQQFVSSLVPGTTVTLKIIRNGAEVNLDVELRSSLNLDLNQP